MQKYKEKLPLLHLVLSCIGLGLGHSALRPSQVEDNAHSLAVRHVTLSDADTKWQDPEQHCPCDGLKK